MAKGKEQGKPQHWMVGGGDEPEVSRRAKEIFVEWAPEDPLNAEKVDGRVDTVEGALTAVAKAREGLETLPFLGGRKLVWLADCTFLGDNVTGRNESVRESLASLIELLGKLPPSEAQFLISAPGVDKRRSFFRQFEKWGKVEVFDPPDLRRGRDRGDWMDEISERLRRAGLTAGPGVVELLMEIVGWDGRTLEKEMEKLRLYLKPETKVTEQAVREVGAGRRELEVWDWCDAVVAGKLGPARAGLRRLLEQGESDVGLVMILAGSLRLAALGRALQEARLLRLPAPGGLVNPVWIRRRTHFYREVAKGKNRICGDWVKSRACVPIVRRKECAGRCIGCMNYRSSWFRVGIGRGRWRRVCCDSVWIKR